MYGHPTKPDPWAEVQEIPPYSETMDDTDPSGFTVGALVVALPTAILSFLLGYMSGVWGWI